MSRGRRRARDQPTAVAGRRRRTDAEAKKGSLFKELPFLVVDRLPAGAADQGLPRAGLLHPVRLDAADPGRLPAAPATACWSTSSYDFRDPSRGEIVVFNGPDTFPEIDVAEPANGSAAACCGSAAPSASAPAGEKDFIKRVIGVAGRPRRLLRRRRAGCTVRRRSRSTSPTSSRTPPICERPAAVRPPVDSCPRAGCGSWATTAASADSRSHIDDENQGTVPPDKVIGRAFVIVWPLEPDGLLSVPDIFDGGARRAPAGGAGRGAAVRPGRRRRAAGRGACARRSPLGAAPPLARAARPRLRRRFPGGRLLLLDCVDPHRADVRWWELPGGGVEPGEARVRRSWCSKSARRRSQLVCTPGERRPRRDPRAPPRRRPGRCAAAWSA